MADDESGTGPPGTPHGSELGELDEHGKALGSSFPELWGVSSPESNDGTNIGDTDEILSPESVKSEALSTSDDTPAAVVASTEEGAPLETKQKMESVTDSTFKVSNLRESWKQKEQTTKRSQLLNLDDFHMQQRFLRVGDKLKKGEAAEHLHSFRNHDAPSKALKDSAPQAKQPAPEQTKAADRAAMAQYMMLRRSKEREPKPPSGVIAPHRTLSLRNRPPELAISKSGDESVSSTSSSKASASKWRKSPTSGKSVIVTDVDEFYAQQHAIHLENERKKREILHISDNKERHPDKTSSLPPADYVKSMIPSFVDSTQDEGEILAMASSSNFAEDSNARPEENGAFPPDLTAEFNARVEDTSDGIESEVADESQWEEQQNASSQEKCSEAKVSVGETSVGVTAPTASSSNLEQTSATKILLVVDLIDGVPENDIGKSTTDGQDGNSTHLPVGGIECDENSSAPGRSENVISSEPSSNELSTTGISGNLTTVEAVPAESSAQDDTLLDRFGSNDAIEPDTANDAATDKGSNEVTRNIKETSDLDDDFTLIDAEDAECHDDGDAINDITVSYISAATEIVSRPIVHCEGANPESEIDQQEGAEVVSAALEPDDLLSTKSMESETISNSVQSSVDDELESKALGDMEGHRGSGADSELVDHVPDGVSNASRGNDGDPTAIIDGNKPAGGLVADTRIDVATIESATDHAMMEPVDHVPDGVSIDSLGKDDSTGTVDGETPSEALAADSGLGVGASTESASETPGGATEVLDHVPDDVSIVPSSKDDSTLAVDGETPSEALAADVDLDVAVLQSKLDEPVATEEVLDHVPDDVSNVSSHNDDSTAAVDGETPSEALEADIYLDILAAEAASDEMATVKVLDNVPGGISNVSLDKDESTAAVAGETTSEGLAADIGLEVGATESALDTSGAKEILDHVPDDVSVVSSDRNDSSATVDGETPSEALAADSGLGMGASTESTSDNPGATEVLDHVPDDVSIVSSDKDNSTATVDGETPSEALAADIGLGVGASTESASDNPGATEVLDHVPNDVSIVSSDKGYSTATVDKETPSEALATDVDLDVAVLQSKLDEPVATAEVLDDVPDDVSNVSSHNDDSTAAVDGETPSEALEADIYLDILAAEAALDEMATVQVLDSVPGGVSNISLDKDESTAAVAGETTSEGLAADIGLGVGATESALDTSGAKEVLDHVPDDVSVVSSDRDDSTATVDGETPSEALAADSGLRVGATGSALDTSGATEVLDHVPDDVSNVSSNNDDSTAAVDGETPSETLAADIGLGMGASTESPSDNPGATEVLDHVPDDVSIVSSDKDNSTATVDGETPSEALAADIGLGVGASTESASDNPGATEVLDHVPNDVSIVSSDKGYSTATVDKETPSEALATDVDLDVAVLHSKLDEPVATAEVLDHVPDDVSNVSSHNDDSTAAVDGETPSEALEADIYPDILAAEAALDEMATVQVLDSVPGVVSDDAAVLEALLADEDALESQTPKAPSKSFHADNNDCVDETENEKDRSASIGDADSQEEAVLDALLASSDDTGETDEEASKQGDVEPEAVMQRGVFAADHSVEGGLSSSETITDECRAEIAVAEQTESGQILVGRAGSPEPRTEEAILKNRSNEVTTEVVREDDAEEVGKVKVESTNETEGDNDDAVNLIENLLADQSVVDVFEETEGDTSDYHSAQPTELENADITEGRDVSAIYFASSKDTDDAFPSEVVAALLKDSPSDERVDEIMRRDGKLANSRISAVSGTDSSEERITDALSSAPSAGSTEKPAGSNPGAKVEVDYKRVDYRGFIFVVHKQYGLMLLHCTRKKKKGPHFQLPGGHIDEHEFFEAAEESRDSETQLLLASRAGAARELYEETGLDVRYQLDRLEPAALRNGTEFDDDGKPVLENELKHRLYFFLPVTDDDFWSSDKGDSETGKMHPMGAALGCEGAQLMLRLSVEHQGWTFEKDRKKSALMLKVHSDGQGAIALRMSMARGTSGLEEAKPAATEEQVNKELQSNTWETEPLAKDETACPSNQEIPRSSTDLLPQPEESGIMKLFNCCPGWFGHHRDER